MKNYTNRSPKRNEDERKNLIVNSFLDNYVYTEQFGFDNVKRNDKKKLQIRGVDIEFDFNGNHYICDEKASTDKKYIEKYLSTFSLELSMKNQMGFIDKGWLLNEKEINNSYLFIWIDRVSNYDFVDINEINQIEIALVRKEKILEYLEKNGWTTKKLKIKDERIRNHIDDRSKFGNYKKNGLKFSFSENLPEQPINVLLKRYVYRKIADFNKIIKLDI